MTTVPTVDDAFTDYRVVARRRESDVITSFELAPVAGGRVKSFVPGQFLVLRLPDADGTGTRRVFADPDQHLYGACVSPDGQYVLFTRSREDLGQVPEIALSVIRWPSPGNRSDASPPRLDLGPGWEPHWSTKADLR